MWKKKLLEYKAIALILAVALMVAFGALLLTTSKAQAQTISELIELLIALDIVPAERAAQARSAVNQLSPAPASVCPYTWTRDLTLGASGSDVLTLQKFLNADAATRLAASGPGSPGQETQHFGPITRSAVIKFQEQYASEVLAPAGLSRGTGFVGPLTRAKLNRLCVVPSTPPVIVVPPVDDDDDDELPPPVDDTDDEDDVVTPPTRAPQEANIHQFRTLNAPSSVDFSEGEERPVLGVRFDVRDGAATLSRIDVNVRSVGTVREDDPWRLIDRVLIYDGSDVLAEVRANRESDWSRINNTTYRIRLTGLQYALDEDERGELLIAVEARSQIDSTRLPQDMEIWVPDLGARFRDGAGVDHFVGNDNARKTFTIEQAGEREELRIGLSNASPEAGTIAVDETRTSGRAAVLVFELEAEDGDIEIRELPVSFYTYHENGVSVAYADVVQKLWLRIDGHEYDDIASTAATAELVNGASTTKTVLTFEFDRDELVIGEGETVDVEVMVTFRRLAANYAEGQRVRASVTSDNRAAIQAEGVDDLTGSKLRGQATGETHQLRTTGIALAARDEQVSVTTNRDGDAVRATYSLTFEVTAFGEDVYVPLGAARVGNDRMTPLGGTSTAGIRYTIENSLGSVTTDGTANQSVTSNADRRDGAYLVRDGETRRFTLSVVYRAASAGFYHVQLERVGFRELGEDDREAVFHRALPQQRFETRVVNLDT